MKALDVLRKKNIEEIEKHVKAKHAPELTDDERTDIERFREAYDQACLDERGEGRPTLGFSPSALGSYAGKCQRRFVYLFRGAPTVKTFDARTIRVFANGTDFHTRIQGVLDKMAETMGFEHEAEIRILYPDPPVRAYVDGVIKLPWNGKEIVVEHKSTNENGFIGRKKWKAAKVEHLAQCNLYAYILGIETIWVIYECKNDQDYEIYEHKMDPKAAIKQLDIWRNTWKMHEEGRLPKRPYKPTSQACNACEVRDHCMADPTIGE